ncbi:MAG: energy transducer TonB [Myxococcota bacterium]
MSLNRAVAAALITFGFFSLTACQAKIPTPTELQAAITVTSAHQAYRDHDCATVDRLTGGDLLDAWEFNEMRHSMRLLQGFCHELGDDLPSARKVYRGLVVEAPASFASRDAEERIRILKITEANPDYLSWTKAARSRIDRKRVSRNPIDRVRVKFPPVAKATGIAGFTVVEFGVTKSGATMNPVVVDSSPPLVFDGTSVRAVRRWRYQRELGADPNHRQLIRFLFRPEEGPANSIKVVPEPLAPNGFQ